MAETRSEEEVTTGLMVLVHCAGNATEAARFLEAERGISISASALGKWKQRHAERYDELCEKYREPIEKRLKHELRELAFEAASTSRLAVEKTRERLEAGEEPDPARAAANTQRVAQSALEKMLTLDGRPSSISGPADPEAILRGLEARHPGLFPERQKELEKAADAE